VRLVGPNGEQVGIVAIGEALQLAQENDLDLVEVAPMARPPVAKLMDYGKFKYETAQKARESRKNQVLTGHQGDEAPPEDRPARLRDQEGSRGPLPQAGRQGQDHHHVPRARAVAPELGFRLLQRLGEDVQTSASSSPRPSRTAAT
jgi:translation initiation factor IF-3